MTDSEKLPRGRPRKYHFSDMKVGAMRRYKGATANSVATACQVWQRKNNNMWRFRFFRDGEWVIVLRLS